MIDLNRLAFAGVSVVCAIAMTGCVQVPDNATREGANGIEIQINEGRNCWSNQCLRYDAQRGELFVAGRERVAIPDGVDLRDGYASEAEFAALLAAVRNAPQVPIAASDSKDSGNVGGAGEGGRGNAGGN